MGATCRRSIIAASGKFIEQHNNFFDRSILCSRVQKHMKWVIEVSTKCLINDFNNFDASDASGAFDNLIMTFLI